VLNAIHPFREGNGRTQTAFMTLTAVRAGHPFNLEVLDPVTFLSAMIRSFHGQEEPLAQELRKLTA
jgi:cell filamentation protein